MVDRQTRIRDSWWLVLSRILTSVSLAIVTSYYSFCFTDLAGISPTLMSTCMFVCTSASVVLSFFSGAFVQNTRTRLGQYRPWIMFGPLATILGGFMLLAPLFGQGTVATAVFMAVGYFIANSSMDFIGTANYGTQGLIGGSDSNLRTLISGRAWQGGALGLVMTGLITLPLVRFFGGGQENLTGFRGAQFVFFLMVMAGSYINFSICKKYDLPNKGAATAATEKTKFLDMIQGVIANRPAMMVILSDVLRFTGYYVLFSLMVYHCTYVIGDMNAMTYTLSTTNLAAFIGATLAPMISEKFGGRKRTAILFSILTGGSCIFIGIFGYSLWGFVIPCSLYFFFMSFLDTIDIPMYLDAAEYWQNKTGKDTRAYMLSMYSVAVKIAIAVSTVALGAILNLIHYTPGMVLDDAGAKALCWATALSPGLGYLLPVILLLIHGVSDKEMARIIEENAKKYGVVDNQS